MSKPIVRVALAVLLIVSVLLSAREGASQSGGGTSPPPPAQAASPELIVRRPDVPYTKPINSFVKNEPFIVEVRGRGLGPTATVTLADDAGTTRTLEIPETAPGSGSYLSQPITVEGGAPKTEGLGKHVGGNLGRAMDGFTSAKEGAPITDRMARQT